MKQRETKTDRDRHKECHRKDRKRDGEKESDRIEETQAARNKEGERQLG